MPTRVVHRVRCRKKGDSQTWADVKVLDAVTVLAPGGKSMLLWTRAKEAIPLIVDETGDNNGVQNENPTRVSHMERVHSEEDPNQKFDIEVLDAAAFQPPHVGSGDQSRELQDAEAKHGLAKAATFGHGPFAVFMPDKDSIKFTVDKTGLNLGSGSAGSASRSGHVNLVTEKGNTDLKTDGLQDAGDSVPPHILDWCATIKTDAINFKAPHGANILLYTPLSDQDEHDTTKEVNDPDTGLKVPPDNTDPNKYVCFPDDAAAGGKSTGLSVGIPIHDKTGEKKPISQGPLWWIERISPSFRPWFWYATVNTPLAFSFFGAPGRLGSWAWRGFVLWNNYPVIWILSANNALVPMGTFGSESLELCAEKGDWDFSSNPVPGSTFLAPGRPEGSTVQFPFSALNISGISTEFVTPGGGDPIVFAPFGLLSMTHAPIGKAPDAMPYGAVGDGDQLWDGRPNIWQLTGLPQPARGKPGEAFDPVKNPFPPPSQKKAEEAAKKFETNWASVVKGHNDYIAGYQGDPGTPRAVYTTPPGWLWDVPFFDAFLGDVGGNVLGYHAAFQNGIPPGIATHSLPLEVYAPATTWSLAVDQLDPKKWDTSKLEYYKHPEKYALGQFEPPQTYESEKP